MCNFANEITKSNIINKLDKRIFSDPISNNIPSEEMDMANVKHVPYKIVIKYSMDNQTNPSATGYFVQKINLRNYHCILFRSIRAAELMYYEILSTNIEMTQGKIGKQ